MSRKSPPAALLPPRRRHTPPAVEIPPPPAVEIPPLAVEIPPPPAVEIPPHPAIDPPPNTDLSVTHSTTQTNYIPNNEIILNAQLEILTSELNSIKNKTNIYSIHNLDQNIIVQETGLPSVALF